MNFQTYLLFVYFSGLTLLSLVGLPIPFSVPPRPMQPALVRVAPGDALAWIAWAGAAEPDPDSGNRTEAMAAEPELRHLVARLRGALTGAIAAEAGPAAGLATQVGNVVAAALQRPGCVFVRDLAYQPRPRLAGGIVLQLDQVLPGAKALMTALDLAMAPRVPVDQRHADVVVDGVSFRALPVGRDHTFLGWAELDGWFALAIGTDTPAQIVAGLRGQDRGLEQNRHWRELAPKCAVARPVVQSFLDVERTCGIIGDSGGDLLLGVLAALGLQPATAAVACAGLEGDGFVSRLRLRMPQRAGLLGALAGAPLDQGDLCRIPLDADVALATRVDVLAVEQAIIELGVALAGPGARAEYERDIVADFEREFGLRWRQDLLAHLGDQLTLWNAPGQGGALFTAAAGTISLRDGKALQTSLQKIAARLAEQMPGKQQVRDTGRRLAGSRVYLETFRHAGQPVWWLDSHDSDWPFAFTWTATDQHAIVGMVPQPVRTVLDGGDPANPDRSLARLPLLNRRGNAGALVYWNPRSVLEQGYAPLLVLLQASAYEWQRGGFDFDLADVPRRESLLRHLDRELLLLEPAADGWALTRQGTLPMADPLTILLVGGLAVLAADG